ncbi:FKBP-type peptidyl-prolyl cis-trans isomerase [Undibacterium flavidum]|uniref:Peptidyl-prolyl cis-trans isomerase n=1 Tax=Undibacterium flavidum TaxID=2762297 RepID=A0ABR6YBR4_9BURK|nr:FKBP-type peptidyl-prolyl cis-trans isomerase [Undibacterium flavidum]MBC3874084.1 FKBP-type peptidyl-prolyl cis-trans isomerase [Undibacterium flavidum]
MFVKFSPVFNVSNLFNVSKVALILSLILSVVACNRGRDDVGAALTVADASGIASLQTTDTVIGNGALAQSGKQVTVHYTGWLYDSAAADKHGKQFDSSIPRGTPFSFQLGDGQVIKGWDQGVAGMKVGGRRTLVIPSDLAYGPDGRGPIPPAATLVFDVELIAVN